MQEERPKTREELINEYLEDNLKQYSKLEKQEINENRRNEPSPLFTNKQAVDDAIKLFETEINALYEIDNNLRDGMNEIVRRNAIINAENAFLPPEEKKPLEYTGDYGVVSTEADYNRNIYHLSIFLSDGTLDNIKEKRQEIYDKLVRTYVKKEPEARMEIREAIVDKLLENRKQPLDLNTAQGVHRLLNTHSSVIFLTNSLYNDFEKDNNYSRTPEERNYIDNVIWGSGLGVTPYIYTQMMQVAPDCPSVLCGGYKTSRVGSMPLNDSDYSIDDILSSEPSRSLAFQFMNQVINQSDFSKSEFNYSLPKQLFGAINNRKLDGFDKSFENLDIVAQAEKMKSIENISVSDLTSDQLAAAQAFGISNALDWSIQNKNIATEKILKTAGIGTDDYYRELVHIDGVPLSQLVKKYKDKDVEENYVSAALIQKALTDPKSVLSIKTFQIQKNGDFCVVDTVVKKDYPKIEHNIFRRMVHFLRDYPEERRQEEQSKAIQKYDELRTGTMSNLRLEEKFSKEIKDYNKQYGARRALSEDMSKKLSESLGIDKQKQKTIVSTKETKAQKEKEKQV